VNLEAILQLSLDDFPWAFHQDFWWILSLENEDSNEVNFSCNGEDYNGPYMLRLNGYSVDSAADLGCLCFVLSLFSFLWLDVRNEGGELADSQILLHVV